MLTIWSRRRPVWSCSRMPSGMRGTRMTGDPRATGAVQAGDPNVQAMLSECARSVDAVLNWWAGHREEVPADVRAYLQLGGWGGREREDWFPLHAAIEAAGGRVRLLRKCLQDAVHVARESGERQREQQELKAMRSEEAGQRVYLRRAKATAAEWARKESQLAEYRAAWRRGRVQRDEAAAQQAQKKVREAEETRRRKAEARSARRALKSGTAAEAAPPSRLDTYKHSPWVGVQRGCSRFELEELIAEERKRRKHQEGRTVPFHVNDAEHDTGKRLLHQAAFWGHTQLVEYLLARGADPRQQDSCVTRFTPLDEAARGGSPGATRALLAATGIESLFMVRNLHGDTPIHTAARHGRSQALAAMVEYCKNCKVLPDVWLGGGGRDVAGGETRARTKTGRRSLKRVGSGSKTIDGGRSAGAETVFKLVDLQNGKNRTPLQVTTNDGCREVILAASEWAITAAAEASVFAGANRGKGGTGWDGKQG